MAITSGHTITLLDVDSSTSGTSTKEVSVESDNVLISLYVDSTAGDVDVSVATLTDEGKEVDIVVFPTVSSPTSELLIRKSAVTMSRVLVTATYTDSCSFEVRARGIGTGESSVRILGVNEWSVETATVGTSAALLIPTSLTDRNGIAIRNHDATEDIYIAPTLALATIADGWPVLAGETVQMDLTAGSEVYAIGTGSGIDIRIIQAGG